MVELNIFKIEYNWYEGEHNEILLAKDIERKEFEKDIIKAKKFAESLIGKKIKEGDYLGKGYTVGCLPEYYEQIIWFLTKELGYFICNFDDEICYSIDDLPNKRISVNKSELKVVESNLF